MNWKTLPNVQVLGYEKQTISNIPSILVEYNELGIRKFMTVLAKKIKYDKYDFYNLTYYGYEGEYYNHLDIAKEMMRSVEIIN